MKRKVLIRVLEGILSDFQRDLDPTLTSYGMDSEVYVELNGARYPVVAIARYGAAGEQIRIMCSPTECEWIDQFGCSVAEHHFPAPQKGRRWHVCGRIRNPEGESVYFGALAWCVDQDDAQNALSILRGCRFVEDLVAHENREHKLLPSLS